MKIYDDTIESLKLYGIKAGKTVNLKKDGESCVGLWVWCNPLLKDKKKEQLQSILGDSWRVWYLSSLEELHFKIKE